MHVQQKQFNLADKEIRSSCIYSFLLLNLAIYMPRCVTKQYNFNLPWNNATFLELGKQFYVPSEVYFIGKEQYLLVVNTIGKIRCTVNFHILGHVDRMVGSILSSLFCQPKSLPYIVGALYHLPCHCPTSVTLPKNVALDGNRVGAISTILLCLWPVNIYDCCSIF